MLFLYTYKVLQIEIRVYAKHLNFFSSLKILSQAIKQSLDLLLPQLNIAGFIIHLESYNALRKDGEFIISHGNV